MAIQVNYVRRPYGLTIYIERYECQLTTPLKMPSTILDEFIDEHLTPTLDEDDTEPFSVIIIREAIDYEFSILLEKIHNLGVLKMPEHLRAPLAELKEKVVEIQGKLQGKEAPKEKA